MPTEAIVLSVEAVLSRQHELSESTKDNIRSGVTSTLQPASLPNSNLKPETGNRREHSHTSPREVRVTVVMDKTDYNNKKDALINDKLT